MNPRARSVQFPNLDALRFFSFFAVFAYHCFLYFPSVHADDAAFRAARALLSFREQGGELGVSFFFVLSGFLITYLMIREHEATGALHVGWFYVRRALRIWPLYFAVVLFGFYVWPLLMRFSPLSRGPEVASPLAFLLFYANFDVIRHGAPTAPVLGVQWSLAVEEQYYLAWPVVFALAFRRTGRAFVTVVVGLIAASLLFRLMHAASAGPVLYYHTFSVMGDLAMGALAACAVARWPAFVAALERMSRGAIVLVYAAGALVVWVPDLLPGNTWFAVRRLPVAAFFAFVILEQNFATRSFVKVGRFRRLTRLGQYTYGLYSLHMVGILAVKFLLRSREQSFALRSVLALGASIGLAVVSYHLFEMPFLRLKDRFSVIRRGEAASSAPAVAAPVTAVVAPPAQVEAQRRAG